MHVAFWSSALPDSEKPTGILTYVKIMRAALGELGHKVTVLSPDGICLPSGEIVPASTKPAPVARIRQKFRDAFCDDSFSRFGADMVFSRLMQAHRIEPVDIVELEESFGWTHYLRSRSPCPIVVRLHGPHFLGRDEVEAAEVRRRGDVREISEKRGMMAADAITCPSARLMAATLEHYGLAPAIAETIPNPIHAVPAQGRWSMDRADPKQILCVGRFDLRKGADIVVRAFAQAAAVDPELRLVMAGPDNGLTQPDGSLVHFDAFAETNVPVAVRERIRFLGTVPSASVQELRLASGVSLVASRFENFAYSIAEGMALGMPMIVSDSFGNGEMVEDGRTGIVVPVGDVDATAAAILRMAQNPSGAADMGARSYEKCVDWLSPMRVAADTVALYERTIGRRRRAA